MILKNSGNFSNVVNEPRTAATPLIDMGLLGEQKLSTGVIGFFTANISFTRHSINLQ